MSDQPMTPIEAADYTELAFASTLHLGARPADALRVLIDTVRDTAIPRDQAYVALGDQWRLDADNLRNAELPKSALLLIAEHLDQAAQIVGGDRP